MGGQEGARQGGSLNGQIPRGAWGLHPLRLEEGSAYDEGRNPVAGWGASSWCLIVSRYPRCAGLMCAGMYFRVLWISCSSVFCN